MNDDELGSVEKAWVIDRFDAELWRSRGDAFQGFFARLLERSHRGRFVAVRPYGNL